MNDIQEQLIMGRKSILENRDGMNLLKILRENILNFSDNVYVINLIPEQTEDLYTLLVNNNLIVEVELSRLYQSVNPIIFKVVPLAEYTRSLQNMPKSFRRKLEAAIKLSK